MEDLPIREGARDIFASFFGQLLEPEDYSRAQTIFDTVAGANERSIALQMNYAFHTGKLEEVLAAYERLIAPGSWYHNVPDAITKAAEVRHFSDVVYSSVISSGDPMEILDLVGSIGTPAELNGMDIEPNPDMN